MKTSFKLEYRNLEQQVLRALRFKVEESEKTSNYVTGAKAINISSEHFSIFNDGRSYTELAIVNDRLVIIDSDGQQYDIFVTELETLIDVLEKL